MKEKQFWKKWWFWLLLVVLIAALIPSGIFVYRDYMRRKYYGYEEYHSVSALDNHTYTMRAAYDNQDTYSGMFGFTLISKEAFSKLTYEDLKIFSVKVHYQYLKWVTLDFEDGTGLQMKKGDLDGAVYGLIDDQGEIVKELGRVEDRKTYWVLTLGGKPLSKDQKPLGVNGIPTRHTVPNLPPDSPVHYDKAYSITDNFFLNVDPDMTVEECEKMANDFGLHSKRTGNTLYVSTASKIHTYSVGMNVVEIHYETAFSKHSVEKNKICYLKNDDLVDLQSGTYGDLYTPEYKGIYADLNYTYFEKEVDFKDQYISVVDRETGKSEETEYLSFPSRKEALDFYIKYIR